MIQRFLSLALVALFAIACGGNSGLTSADGELHVSPDSLDFGDTWIGHPGEKSIELRNGGQSAMVVELLQLQSPFSTPSQRIELSGGEVRDVTIHFDPVVEGDASGTLLVRGPSDHEVALRGRGVAPPTCPPSTACTTIRFDPASGCVEEKAENGTDCGDACIEGQCLDGACVGTTRTCDDGDACTVDSCDPVIGCVSYGAPACPGSDDPCKSPLCDPATGCGFVAAEDGTACGEANCTKKHVCLQGTCTEVTTPDGGACGEETPCKEFGTCVDGRCLSAPAHPLEPIWEAPAAPGAVVFFDGTTDAQGNLYWAECTFESCDLVSTTLRGFPRIREAMFAEDVGRAPTGSVVLAGTRVISTLAPGRVEAFDASNGSRSWSRPLAEALELAPGGDAWLDEAAPPVIGDAVVIVAVEGYRFTSTGGAEGWGGWLVGLSVETGEVLWKVDEPGTFAGLIGDESGSVLYAVRRLDVPETEGGELVSRGPGGQQRWRVPSPWQPPLATLGGLVIQANGEVRTATAGDEHGQLRLLVPTWPQRSPLLSGGAGYAFGMPLEPCETGLCPVWQPHLFRFDPDSGDELWRVSLARNQTTEPVITTDLSVIFARPPTTSGSFRLLELAADDGSELFSCAMPAGKFEGAAAFHAGIWVTVDGASGTVYGFDLKGRKPPQRGWVGHRGSPARTGRPR